VDTRAVCGIYGQWRDARRDRQRDNLDVDALVCQGAGDSQDGWHDLASGVSTKKIYE